MPHKRLSYPPGLGSLSPNPRLDYDNGFTPILQQSEQKLQQGGGDIEPEEITIHPPRDDIRVDRTTLPRLRMKGGDSITATRLVHEWLQRTAVVLDTWSGVAISYWAQCVRAARQLHHSWLSLSPALRVSQGRSPIIGYPLPLQLPVHETLMTAELLGALPAEIVSQALLEGKVSVLDLPLATFKTLLPSEPSAQSRAIAEVEAPLPAAKTYNQALSTLSAWKIGVLTVVLDMGGDPEPPVLLSSLRALLSTLVQKDAVFSKEVVRIEATSDIQIHCSDVNLLRFITLLEIELSSRACAEERLMTTKAMRGGKLRKSSKGGGEQRCIDNYPPSESFT